jgi:hypothetical protein
VALSNAEKSRRWRERRKAEREARERYDRGLPEPPPAPTAPEGAYFPSEDSDVAVPKFGHYAAADGTFPSIPDDILSETITTADGEVVPLNDAQMKARCRPDVLAEIAARAAPIYEAWQRERDAPMQIPIAEGNEGRE